MEIGSTNNNTQTLHSKLSLDHATVLIHHFQYRNIHPQNLTDLLGSTFMCVMACIIEIVAEVVLQLVNIEIDPVHLFDGLP